MKIPAMDCDVCGVELAIGVACVPYVPISVAYGIDCLRANAHPYWVLVANTAACDGFEYCDEGWQKMVFDTLNHLNISFEKFTEDVRIEIEEFMKMEQTALMMEGD